METPDWVKREVRGHYAEAARAGRRADLREPRAAKVAYLPRSAALLIELKTGVCLSIPVKLIPYLNGVASRDLARVEIQGRGSALHWERIDQDLGVPQLIASVLNSPAWMSEMGRMGGRRTSVAKANAARRNGRKGGRPRTSAAVSGPRR
jgi:hypothetical protein